MKKRYNKTGFRVFKKIMESVRKLLSADPFEKIKELGLLGRVVARIFDGIIETLTHKLSYRSTGLVFEKKHDKPYKGSAIYTFNYLSIKRAFKLIIDFIFVLPVFSFVVQLLTAEPITQLRMLFGFIPLVLICLCVYNIIQKFRR